MVVTEKPSTRWRPLRDDSAKGSSAKGSSAKGIVKRFEEDDYGPAGWLCDAGRVIGYTSRSPSKPPPNEDALAAIETADGNLVLVIADGMGGQATGETAARLAIESVCKAVASVEGEEDRLRSAIIDGIEDANQSVVALANGAGATLAVAFISDAFARSFHVGDSAIMLMGQRGKMKFESIAHSPVGYAEAAGLIDVEDALHHEERHLVSNFIGSEQMRIEIGPVLALSKYDTLLLASDGLVDNLLPAEIVDTMRAGPLDGCCQRLADAARERMTTAVDGQPSKPDDLTFLAFRRG